MHVIKLVIYILTWDESYDDAKYAQTVYEVINHTKELLSKYAI